MANLPTGTVTFLFTDIEGSTCLWEAQPEAMRRALLRHDQLVEVAVEKNGGVVVRPRGEGDSRFAVFALALQLALQAEPWPSATPLRVRMALHTGEADLREGDYYGTAVNRCARLHALAHGGQVLLSLTTMELVRDHLPERVWLRDLGEQRLSDLSRPEHVFQLLQPSVPADFPPLRSLDTYRHNLPLQLTSFVGREAELADIRQALTRSRLLTLTGTGGCGKTRLALQAAADALERFPDGAWLVELAPVADPALVAAGVAAVLAISAQPGQALEATLIQALRTKRMLLLLDNCEHLLDACARLADVLLRGCPGLVILATSREALGIAGEMSRRVPSLGLPDGVPSIDQVAACAAVRLFTERALAVQPAFVVTGRNAAALAQLCRRLDGIPLALELAAARIPLLSVEQLAERLDQRFRLLTGGSRAALPRQQTLQAAIDWSYALLDDQERRLFGRLAAFAGGFTLDAAEAVCTGEGTEQEDVLDLLARLVDMSLVVADEQPDGKVRYRLLETLRQYGREKLLATGEADAVYDRHAAFYAALARAAVPRLQGANQIEALEQQQAEDRNLCQALEWLIGRGDGEAAACLAADRSWFWLFRSQHPEGREAVQRALATPRAGPAARSLALAWLGFFCNQLGMAATARGYADEALALARHAGDQRVEALASLALGNSSTDWAEKQRLLADALTLYRALGDHVGVALATQQNVMVAVHRGDERMADALLVEGDRLWRQLGRPWGLAQHLWLLGRRALRHGDLAEAREQLEGSLRLWRSVGYRTGVGSVLTELGLVAQAQGDLVTARRFIEQAAVEHRDSGRASGVASALIELADVLLQQGEHAHARRLLAEALPITRAGTFHQLSSRALDVLVGAEVLRGRPARALRVAGTATAWRDQADAF